MKIKKNFKHRRLPLLQWSLKEGQMSSKMQQIATQTLIAFKTEIKKILELFLMKIVRRKKTK